MNRREAVSAIGMAVASCLVGSSSKAVALATQARELLALPLPALDFESPSFLVFERLCLWVTGRKELSDTLLQACYPLFMTEPWGPKHISTAFTAIARALEEKNGDKSVPQLIAEGVLERHEKWFVSHLLETLYLGIYNHEVGIVRVVWADAVMNELIADYRLAPGEYATWRRPGFWAEAPSAVTSIRAPR